MIRAFTTWMLLATAPLAGLCTYSTEDVQVTCPTGRWSSQKADYLATKARQAQEELLDGVASYHYPFSLPLRYALKRQGKETIPLLSYGSLMSRQSAERTLDPETVATSRPAVAFGIRRIFNYEGKRRGDAPDPLGIAMLNTQLSWSTGDMVNGVVVDIPIDELRALCQREVGYDLVPVVTVNWDQALASDCLGEPTFFVSYTLRAFDTPNQNTRYTSRDITPYAPYYAIVCEAAASYGPEFLQLYEETTYLADGKTTLADWERCHARH